VGRLGDFQKTPPIILAEFDDEVLALDSDFAGRDGLFHMNLG
jgi:hypothetical protein